VDRRSFLLKSVVAAGALRARRLFAIHDQASSKPGAGVQDETPFGAAGRMIPDEGWRMWPDRQASWENDTIYLPEDTHLEQLPVNPPTGGWGVLNADQGIAVTLPATVEQFFWGRFGLRPYSDDYGFSNVDHEVKAGNYKGVSWWWRPIDMPAAWKGRHIFLHVRAARQRCEVYLNEKLVGYSILEELPFSCDLTQAARPGEANRLALRITNPGGQLDWRDTRTQAWGGLTIQRSHAFGGVDRALMLSAHGSVRITDCWALNTPVPKQITAHATLESVRTGATGAVEFEVLDKETQQVLASARVPLGFELDKEKTVQATLTAPAARIWDLDAPHLYELRATWRPTLIDSKSGISNHETRTVDFGFRWFAVDGLGSNALFRLNGRRVRIYTAISWGYWGLNGLFPIPELAEKEVRAAKQLGLNTLNFHRNLGKEDVFRVHDREGLMRCMEPGGGIEAIAPVLADAAQQSAACYMEARIKGMIRAFRSHPSLVHYILQNEARLPLDNPNLQRVLERMHAEDPSRSIVGNDGFVLRSPQAWIRAYGDHLLVSEKEVTPNGGAGSWWVDHTGHFSDVWQDGYYVSPQDFYFRTTDKTEIVEWGEMKGAASSDNHARLIAQIEKHGGQSYDLLDHQELLKVYERFLDRWGFRSAFPTASSLFDSIGRRAYETWGQFMENVRLCDENDMAAISGWESTAIENHSGLVDNFRDWKSDPRPITETLLPIRPVAKQHQLVVALGGKATFDLYLLNDTGKRVPGQLSFTITDPHGKVIPIGDYPSPKQTPDQFSYLLETGVASPPLAIEGSWHTAFRLSEEPRVTHKHEILVVAPAPAGMRALRVGCAGVAPKVMEMLKLVPRIKLESFVPGRNYNVLVASGGTAEDAERVMVNAEGADISKGVIVDAELPSNVLDSVRAGMPLLAITPTDGQADGAAKQLASLCGFTYRGLVGSSRASWMGSWYFVRRHPLYDGLPVDQAMSIHYQVKAGGSNGWLVDGDGVEIVTAYTRDHAREIGAGTFTARKGAAQVVMHRVTDMHPVMLQRLLANALLFLSQRD
jgi:beta-galactosidase